MSTQIYDSLNPKFYSDVDMEFVDYVNGFYGKGVSVWGWSFFPSTGGVTKAEIIMATKIRMLTATEGLPFEGDSMDREAVRDIMIKAHPTYRRKADG